MSTINLTKITKKHTINKETVVAIADYEKYNISTLTNINTTRLYTVDIQLLVSSAIKRSRILKKQLSSHQKSSFLITITEVVIPCTHVVVTTGCKLQ